VEVAKALGGSFKLVTLAPKTVREMTQLPRVDARPTATNDSRAPVGVADRLAGCKSVRRPNL